MVNTPQRRRKQLRFDSRLAAVQERNEARAVADIARCMRRTRALREIYDQLEGEADRALRRRKLIRKSTHLLLHQEIERLLQERERAAMMVGAGITDRTG